MQKPTTLVTRYNLRAHHDQFLSIVDTFIDCMCLGMHMLLRHADVAEACMLHAHVACACMLLTHAHLKGFNI